MTEASHRRTDTVGCHLYEVPRAVRITETGGGLTAKRGGEEAWAASAVWVQSFSFAMNRVLLRAGGDGSTPA